MYWSEILDNAQGIMILEGIENSRVALPMTDSAGMTSFRRGQEEQLKTIWEMMFPRSAEYHKEDEARRDKFAANKDSYRKMKEEINRERGTNSV